MASFNFFAWADPQGPQFTPVSWATGAHEMAQFVANTVAGQLVHRPVNQRPLLVVPAMDTLQQDDIVDLIATGRNVAKLTQWYTTFFQQLAARRCRPTFIGLDEEWGFTTFALIFNLSTDDERVAVMQRFYDNAAVVAKMPPAVAQLTPQSFVANGWATPDTSPQHIAWNQWANSYRDRILRQVVYEPARRAWPGIKVFGSYDVWKPSFTVRDNFGWPYPPTPVTGSSCPVLYLITGRYFTGRAKDENWNMLINMINRARSALLAGRNVVPWVSHPSYDGSGTNVPRMMWLWRELVAHCAASGVSNFIYWNPVSLATDADNAFAANMIDDIRQNPPPPLTADEIGEIELDADEIVSGNLTTTYDDFVTNFLNA